MEICIRCSGISNKKKERIQTNIQTNKKGTLPIITYLDTQMNAIDELAHISQSQQYTQYCNNTLKKQHKNTIIIIHNS